MTKEKACKYTKGEVNRAGQLLLGKTSIEYDGAKKVLDNWRVCHVAL